MLVNFFFNSVEPTIQICIDEVGFCYWTPAGVVSIVWKVPQIIQKNNYLMWGIFSNKFHSSFRVLHEFWCFSKWRSGKLWKKDVVWKVQNSLNLIFWSRIILKWQNLDISLFRIKRLHEMKKSVVHSLILWFFPTGDSLALCDIHLFPRTSSSGPRFSKWHGKTSPVWSSTAIPRTRGPS